MVEMAEFDINHLIEMLPRLIQENDAVRGAIFRVVQGYMPTREEFLAAIAEMGRKHDDLAKRVDDGFEQVDRRFEQVDRRFEQVDRRFEQVDSRFDAIETAIKDLALSINRIESKEGRSFQNTVLELMAETLRLEKVDPSTIRSENLSDPEGIVFFAGYTTDIDVLLENENLYLVEIKAKANRDDVAHFLQNIALYEKRTGKTVTRPILVALRINESAKLLAESQSIRVIAGSVIS